MPRRRFHNKGSSGCKQCKKARKKCDELTPKCGRCQRIGLDCSLMDPESRLIVVQSKCNAPSLTRGESNTVPMDTLPQDPGQTPSPRLGQFELVDWAIFSSAVSTVFDGEYHVSDIERDRLKLVSHYTLNVGATLAHLTLNNAQDSSVWSEWVTELALDCDFLLHGVLGLSALHLALHNNSQPTNIIVAIRHHDIGLALFKPYLINMAHNNYDAVVAFACIIIAYAFGIAQVLELDEDPIVKLCAVLRLLRESSVVVKADYDSVLRSRWASVLSRVSHESFYQPSKDMQQMLDTLRWRAGTLDACAAEMYNSAIDALTISLRAASTHLYTAVTLTSFVTLSPKAFWNVVSTREEPLALALLANYAVILHWQRHNVWMQGWGKSVIDAVFDALPEEWQNCVAWAREQTGPGS